MSSILNESSFKRKKRRYRASRSRGYINGFPRLKFPSFSNPFFPHHSQVDRCRDVKLILAGRKGVGETLNILVHRRSGRRFIIRRTEKRILSLPVPTNLFFHQRVSRPEKRATRIDPSVARDELPANAPPKQIFTSWKRNISPVPLSTFLKRFSRNVPTCRPSYQLSIRITTSRNLTDSIQPSTFF